MQMILRGVLPNQADLYDYSDTMHDLARFNCDMMRAHVAATLADASIIPAELGWNHELINGVVMALLPAGPLPRRGTTEVVFENLRLAIRHKDTVFLRRPTDEWPEYADQEPRYDEGSGDEDDSDYEVEGDGEDDE